MTKRTVESACGNCRLKGSLPFIAMLLGALILAASFLLPFGTARKEYREWLSAAPDRVYDEELNMTRRGAINLSLIELARAFGRSLRSSIKSGFHKASTAIIDSNITTIIAAAVFALLTLLFAVLKKPIPAIVFTMLALGAFLLILKDFDLRGTFSESSNYKLGCACWFAFIGIAAEMFGSILTLAERAKMKKLHIVDGSAAANFAGAADESEKGE